MRAGAVRLAPGGAVAAGLMDRHPLTLRLAKKRTR